ncbi:hypothetical protein FGRMN_4573 [Fusarium graminum]|nr:hypothetical protein FGRMN_4573 [Fusarium graminum]
MTAPIFTLETTSLNAIRSLPPNIYLVHATNCIAEWGAGIAAELATIFPAACAEYKTFCTSAKTDVSSRWPPPNRVGRSYIIPPQASDIAAGAPNVHIVCLFTSYGYGKPNARSGKPGKDNKRKILAQTRLALGEMRVQLEAEREETPWKPTIMYSPMFNSGLFRVPWGETSKLIEEVFKDLDGKWLVMAPP